jgi:hypothetical protein
MCGEISSLFLCPSPIGCFNTENVASFLRNKMEKEGDDRRKG